MHVNFVYVAYMKRYVIILPDLGIVYTGNMNFVSHFDYFAVSYNRQTNKQNAASSEYIRKRLTAGQCRSLLCSSWLVHTYSPAENAMNNEQADELTSS